MPSYRVGGGIEGAATTLLEHIQRQTKRREEEEDAQRDFHRRVQVAVLQGAAERGDLTQEYLQALLSGQPTTGLPIFRTQTPFDASSLGPGESTTFPIPGGGRKTVTGLSMLERERQQQQELTRALAPLPSVTTPTGTTTEGFAPSEVGHPQTQALLQRRLAAMQQTGVAPRQSLGRAASDAQRFRDDVEKALAAFSSGIYTAEEIIAALTEDHPTRIDAIRRLQYELFR